MVEVKRPRDKKYSFLISNFLFESPVDDTGYQDRGHMGGIP